MSSASPEKFSLSRIRRSLRLSLLDAFLYSLMVGAGETYLPAYALSIGLSEVFAGVLSSLPLVSGAFLQLLTPHFLRKVGSVKNWVVISATLQALTFVPLIYFAHRSAPGFWVLFLILTLYWGAGFSISPSWNYWMGHLVPEEIAQKFFSLRSRISQLGLLLGLVGGGIALHNKVSFGPFSSVFGGLFFFAFFCRVMSSLILSRQFFRSDWFLEVNSLGVKKTWGVFLKANSQRKFFLQVFLFILTVHTSAPFVVPYLLGELKLDYGAFMTALAVLLMGKMSVTFFLGRHRSRWSPHQIFRLGVGLAAPLPIFFSLTEKFPAILALQFVSGMAWGAYEIGMLLIFFKNLPQKEKVSFLTAFNFLNSLGIILGTFLGAQFLSSFGEVKWSYGILFAGAALLRSLAAWPLWKKSTDVSRTPTQDSTLSSSVKAA